MGLCPSNHCGACGVTDSGAADESVTAKPLLGEVGHDLRGVSVDYLSVAFLQEVTAAGKTQSAKVYEIEAEVIRAKGQGVLCPRDGRLGAAYVDCLRNLDAGLSAIMLSYTWGYQVGDIIDGLIQYCTSCGMDLATFVWICCLCVNQHRVKEAQTRGETVPFEVFKDTFSSRVSSIGHVVALMAPWSDPCYLKRVWCCFEMFTAIMLGAKVVVEMPSQEAQELADALICNASQGDKAATSEVFKAIASVDVMKAQASVPTDRTNILRLIEESDPKPGLGAERVNQTVSDRLKDWMVDHLERTSLQLLPRIEQAKVVNLCRCVSIFVRETGSYEVGLRLCEEALKVLPEECKEASLVLASMAALYMKANDLVRATNCIQCSIDMRKKLDPTYTQTAEYAEQADLAGVLKRKAGDLSGALSLFMEAKAILQMDESYTDVRTFSMMLGNIGYVLCLQGDFGSAMSHYEEALQVRRRHHAYGHDPDTALILNSIGELRMKRSDIAGALSSFEEAWEIREHTRTDGTPAAQILKKNLEEARRLERENLAP